MKLSDFLSDVGRPVAYYPKLAHEVGGVKAAVFLCQLIYWHGKQADEDGWMFKSVEEWEAETGLTYWEQRTVRRELKKAKLLQEKYRRVEHVIYYRLNLEALNELWEQAVCKSQSGSLQKSICPPCKSQSGSLQKSSSLIGTETTAEITAKTTPKIAREKHSRRPEHMQLSKDFTEITGIQWLEPKGSKAWAAAEELWNKPLDRMLERANGQSGSILRASVKYMKSKDWPVTGPKSVEKTFGMICGERNLSGMKSAMAPDPFASLYEMIERQEHENHH